MQPADWLAVYSATAGRSAMRKQPVRKDYKDRSGTSGVRHYALGQTFIRVWFEDGGLYQYDEAKPGALHVARMKRLAEEGRGLATYINQHVRENYARKL
jgi:hypothetical protein